jgi:hypothetical protein
LPAVSTARADEAEDKAVEFVKKLGGRITRDDKAEGKPVIKVELGDTKVTDSVLKELWPAAKVLLHFASWKQLTHCSEKLPWMGRSIRHWMFAFVP